MKTFFCGDIIPGCSSQFSADDEDGVLAWAAAHGAAEHGITEVTPEVEALVRAHIRTA